MKGKILYYKRKHEGEAKLQKCFYIPRQGVILFKEIPFLRGEEKYLITDQPELLEEAKSILKGDKIGNGEVSNVRRIKSNFNFEELIEDIERKKNLEEKVDSDFKGLLEKVRE